MYKIYGNVLNSFSFGSFTVHVILSVASLLLSCSCFASLALRMHATTRFVAGLPLARMRSLCDRGLLPPENAEKKRRIKDWKQHNLFLFAR